MTARGNYDRAGFHIGLIILAGLAAHGLLLVNDTRVADDWAYLKWMENHEWGTFRRFHEFYNNFLQAVALWPLNYFKNVAAAVHAFSLVILILSAIVVYRICCITRYFNRTESLLVAVFSICFPAFMWHASAIYSAFYNLPVLIFYVALFLAVRSESTSGARKVALQAVSIISFLYSFHTGSLLVFFYGAAIVHCYVIASARSLSWKQAIWFYCTRRIHFLICPVVFRVGYQFLSHAYITNELRLDPETYINGFIQFLLTICSQALNVFSDGAFWLASIGCLVALVAAKLAGGKTLAAMTADIERGPRQAVTTLCLGLALLLAGIFAYVAIGKTPSAGPTAGYTTRTLLLAQVPIAVILISLLQFLSIYPLSRLLIYPVAAGLIASSAAIQIRDSLRWLYLGVLDRSFSLNLAEIPEAKDVTYFIVVDRAFYMGATHHPTASLPFEIARIFRGATYVFAELSYDFDITRAREAHKDLRSLIAEYDLRGINLVDAWDLVLPTEYKQGVLVVCPGPAFHARSQNRLVAAYQYYRWFHPDELRGLLAPLLDLRLITMSPPAGQAQSMVPAISGCARE